MRNTIVFIAILLVVAAAWADRVYDHCTPCSTSALPLVPPSGPFSDQILIPYSKYIYYNHFVILFDEVMALPRSDLDFTFVELDLGLDELNLSVSVSVSKLF